MTELSEPVAFPRLLGVAHLLDLSSQTSRACPSCLGKVKPRHEGLDSLSPGKYTAFMGTDQKGREPQAISGGARRGRRPVRLDEFVFHGRMRDGTPVGLRSVCPDDQAALCAMFAACSPKSLYSRFERQIKERPIDLATQLCSIDGKREIAIVAEIRKGKDQKLIGVGQLLADPDHITAEYAVLVADPWQGKRLGSELTDFCLKVAKRWGVKKVIGEFSPSNVRIIRIFQSRQFQLHRDLQEQIVSGEKIL